MKCVGLLIFVLIIKLFMRDRSQNDDSLDLWDTSSHPFENIEVKEQPHKAIDFTDFRSKLNTTDGILIPENLLLTLPLSIISSNLKTSFHGLQQTLNDVSGSPSKIVSSVATDLFTLLDKRGNEIGTLSKEWSSLDDVIREVFSSINGVITNLDVGTSINDAVSKLESNLLDVVQVLGEAKGTTSNITKKFNDAVFAMATSVQVLISSIAVITEAATLKIAITAEAREAVISLTLILQSLVVFVQSVASSIASIASSISDRITPTSSVLNSYLLLVDTQLPSLTNVLSTITSSALASSISAIVSTVSVTLNSVSYRVNQSFEKLHTSVLLPVSNTLETILLNVIGSEADFASYLTSSAATLVSSIAAISSSDTGLQCKAARRLSPLIKTLSQLSGSDNEIVANFIEALPKISEILQEVSGYLAFSIGMELTNAVTKSVKDVFDILQKLADLIALKKNDSNKLDTITVDCAKAVQILGSSVVAVTKAISGALGSVQDDTLESVVALPVIYSAVLYVVEWVTIVASSVTLTKTGAIHEHIASLAVTIVVILKHVSSVLEIIAISSTQNAARIVNLIASPVIDLAKKSQSLSGISKINANTNAKIDESSSGSIVFVVNGISNAKEGSLSELLNGLTGSLSSISASFSSSLSSLNKSLTQIASSELSFMKSLGEALSSITISLGNITGTASQIMVVTFNSLPSIFGRLLDATSKLINLGDLVSSLVKSVSNISTALHSLLFAINDYKVSGCFINDSFREIAKTVQILIATLAAIIHSAANASEEVLKKMAAEVAALPYLLHTIILVIQQVLGAAIPSVSSKAGLISINQHNLTLSLSSILEKLTYITTDITNLLTDGNLKRISSEISDSFSNLQDYTATSLSKISGVKANIQVTLGLATEAPAS